MEEKRVLLAKISANLDDKFRAEVSSRMGFKKGNISKAVEEALSLWINKE